MIVAIDFDGTLCVNAFPEIGAPIPEAVELVRKLNDAGASVILWTCRNGDHLKKALKWCSAQGLVFSAVNENLPEIKELYGGDTRKVYADLYYDDKNVSSVDELLYKMGE